MSTKQRQPRQRVQIQIIRLLHEHGPMLVKDMTRFIPSKYKSISTTLYKLNAIDLVARDDDSMVFKTWGDSGYFYW